MRKTNRIARFVVDHAGAMAVLLGLAMAAMKSSHTVHRMMESQWEIHFKLRGV